MPFTALANRITAARYRRSGSLWKAKIVPDVTEKSSWQPAQRQILRVGRK
jgi:hypothetical protein